MGVIGKLATDGSTETAPDTCAITGRPLGGHMTTQQIKGTLFFYSYLSDFQFKLTDERRTELEAMVTVKDNNSFEVIGKTKAVKPVEKD